MKRDIKLIAAITFVLSISGCGTQNQGSSVSSSTPTNESATVAEVTETSIPQKSEETIENETQYPITISNFNYAREQVEQTFEKPPERVLAVYQNSIETLLALGLEDRILAAAGLDHEVKPEYAEVFSQVNYLTEFAPDKETVVMMQPDFIISWHSFFGETRLGEVDYWHDSGINTYMKVNSGAVPNNRVLENEYEDILNMGRIFNVEDKAEAIVSEIREEVVKVSEHSQNLDERRKVLVLEFLSDTIHVYGETTLAGDMVQQLNGNLISVEGNSIGHEDLILLNPDVIFVIYMDHDDEDMSIVSINRILNEPMFASLTAVQNEKVYAVPLAEVYCSGIRTIDGIKTLATGIYPELYN